MFTTVKCLSALVKATWLLACNSIVWVPVNQKCQSWYLKGKVFDKRTVKHMQLNRDLKWKNTNLFSISELSQQQILLSNGFCTFLSENLSNDILYHYKF